MMLSEWITLIIKWTVIKSGYPGTCPVLLSDQKAARGEHLSGKGKVSSASHYPVCMYCQECDLCP
jgi:hypothetical protein